MGQRRATPEIWAAIRRELGTDQFRQLWVKPDENVLIGWWKICTYLGIKDRKTLSIWVERWALPAMKRPDGVWMTTMTAVDQWIMLAAQATYEGKHGRGPSIKREESERSEVDGRPIEGPASGL